MGWTPLEPAASAPALPWPAAVYYAHSYGCRPLDERGVLAWSSIEGQGGQRERFAAIVRQKNTLGCQFHPEKSSAAGLALLGALAREVLR
jgi:glutamine amidotransferase